MLFAVEAIGLGRAALSARRSTPRSASCSAARSARTKAIQHPLAESWAELEAANLLAFKAAALYDTGKECGAEANAAKYLGAERLPRLRDRAC